MSKITKRITAMLLSGMLVFGSVPGSVFAVSTDVDLGQTSEIAEEVFSEEASEAPVGAGETAELEETSEATAGAGETSAESYPEEASVGEAVQAQYYTVTLDANGGYFENEWDDAIGNCAQQAEVVEKHIPVDGVVSAFPVYINPDGQTMIFAGWGLERDGELVTAGDEEYAPVDNCVLYAVWKVEEDAPGETGDQEAADEENIERAGAVQDSGEGEDASEKTVTAEEVTQPDLNESSEEGETVSEDAANAEVASGTCGDNLIWTLDEEETLTISGTGDMYDYSLLGKPWGSDIQKVVLEDGITHIGRSAFQGCSSLNSITIPESVTSIGNSAFSNCSSLNSVTIPGKVTRIGNCVFEGCESLTNISIPDNVTSIGDSAFMECSNLSEITLPGSLTAIGNSSFFGCKNLTNINIPRGVTSIEDDAFSGCKSLSSIVLPDTLTSISFSTFSGCSSLAAITIPNSVTSIEGSAFEECAGLTSVTIPESVTCIENYAFYNCIHLSDVFIPSTVQNINWANFLYYNDRTGQKEAVPGLTITGYAGTEAQDYANQYNITFRSVSISISGADITIPDQIYTGENLEPAVTVNLNGKQLTQDIDYIIAYSNNINAGTATVTITGKNKYEGTEEAAFTIEKAFQPLKVTSFVLRYSRSTDMYPFVCGNEGSLTFETSNSAVATIDTSGIVTAKGVGTATITISAAETDNYKLTSKTITVTVPKISQSIIISDLTLIYPNSGKISVSGNEGILTFTSSNTAVATVDASGNVTTKGAGTTTITITAAETDTCDASTKQITVTVAKGTQSITASNLSLTYPNSGKITASGNKGSLSYKSSNTAIATVDSTGKVTAKGAGKATITITAAATNNYNAATKTITVNVAKAAQSITAKAAASSVAVGKTTTVSITGNKGGKSFKSSDTTVATVSSTGVVTAKKVGTVKITATSAATSNYNAASKTVTIKVVPAATASLTAANQATGIKLTWKKVTGANGYKVYRGSTLIKTITSGSTVTFADTAANTNGTKYTYKVVAKATTGDSTLSKSVAVYRVARPTISSATNSAASKMTVKWGKNAKANGYQIQYSLSSSFASGNKAVTITSASTVSRVIGSLTKGKTYYVRIRTYKTVGSTKYWSIWSAARSVKISN